MRMVGTQGIRPRPLDRRTDLRFRFNDDILKDIRKAEITVVPTAFTAKCLESLGLSGKLAQQMAGRNMDRLQAMREAGITLVFGTDTMVEPGDGWTDGTHALSFVDPFVAAGMGGAELLRAMTVDAAEALGLDDRGRVAPGMRADLVAVSGHPVDNPEALREVVFVMRAGSTVRSPTQ